jgi:hypothetical protein
MGTVTRRGSRLFRAGLTLGLLAVLVAGCDLFKPAIPEGGGVQTTRLPNYSHPESCLVYLKFGIERKNAVGTDAYLGALADTINDGVGFHAFFDPAVWNALKAAYPNESAEFWGLTHEAQFLPSFFSVLLCPYEMKWLPDENYPYDATPDVNHMILRRRYEIRAQQKPPADTLLIAVGYADLYFARISPARWALTRWQDRVDPAVGVRAAKDDTLSFGSHRLKQGR